MLADRVTSRWAVVGLALAVLAFAPGVRAASGGFDGGQVLTLGNQYVVLGVTKSGAEAGRFALETTGGSPERPDDDGKPLIYGRPRPWTSYTTVRVDGKDYVFGGPSDRRAGGAAQYGEVVSEPHLQDGAIETVCRLGDLEVRQVLELAKSSTSGLADTARIVYEVTNRGTVSHRVGVRVMLDTMLGSNDGAPIRMGERTLTGDFEAGGAELPSFWQAFDSLSAPTVMAQGTVADDTTVRPSRIVATNWGNLADHPWDAPLVPGRAFVREGEDELDSAVALFWDEEPLEAGASRLYATAYGLGGITIVPGKLTLGITSPASVNEDAAGAGTFPVVAYVQNVGKWPARDVTAVLRLPEGLQLAHGEGTARKLGELAPGGEATLLWHVSFRDLAGTTQTFRVEVDSAGLPPVVGSRAVVIQGPPQLRVEVRPLPPVVPSGDGFSPERVTVEAQVTNAGQAQARLVKASLAVPSGWEPVRMEKRDKFLGNLEAGESRVVRWVIRPLSQGSPASSVEVTAVAANARPGKGVVHADVPALQPRLYAVTSAEGLRPGRFFRVEVRLANVGAEAVAFGVRFDPTRLAVVGVSRGELSVAPDGSLRPFSVGAIDNLAGTVAPIKATLVPGAASGSLVTLHLVALAPGKTRLELEGVSVYSERDSQRVEVSPLILAVEPSK